MQIFCRWCRKLDKFFYLFIIFCCGYIIQVILSISILISIITIILSADFSNNKSASSPNGSPDDTSAPSKDTKWHLCQSSIYIFYSDKSALFFIQLLPCTFFQNWIKYIFLMRKALYDLQLYTSVSAKPESHSPSERIFPWIFFK